MELLELLALKMDCEYLSDLRYLPRPNAMLQRIVEPLPLDDFSEYEWIDAAEYLCGVKCKSFKDSLNAVLFR